MKRIYVQSRGISQDYDYQWKEISFDKNTQEVVDYPPFVKSFQEDFLDSKAPSLLLARSDKKLLLLITDIPSQRKDYRERTIRNSVAWIGAAQEEQILRTLAVRGLQSILGEDYSFPEEINNAVKSDANKGFIVNGEALQAEILAQDFQLEDKSQNLPPRIEYKIAKKGEQRVNELINELKKHELPQHNGALVVVTGNKAQSAFEEALVWRGLSKLVKSEDWIEIQLDSKKNFGNNSKIEPPEISIRPRILLIILGVVVIIILISIPKNSSPEISGNPPNTVAVNTAYNFIPTAEDKDGDTLKFSIENKPEWLNFDKKTGKLSGTPTEDDIGTTPNVVISVSDGNKTDILDKFSITVNPDTRPTISGAPPTIVTVGTPYIFTPIAEDKDGDTLEFSIENQPKWLTFNQGTGKLSGTPNNNDIGTTPNIVISVSDGNKTDILDNFSITVNPDTRPTISGAPPTIVTVGTLYIFTPIAEDPNGDTLEFSIENPPKWLDFNETTGKLSGTPNNNDIGTTPNIVISVSDGKETISLPPFTLTVNP